MNNNLKHTIASAVHFNVNAIRVRILGSKRTEHRSIHLSPIFIKGLHCTSLQSEVTIGGLNECVLAQSIEGVGQVVEGVDVWVTKEPG